MNRRESDFELFDKLFQAMRDDPVLKNKMINILRMETYPRHIVLGNWLEQLRSYLNCAADSILIIKHLY